MDLIHPPRILLPRLLVGDPPGGHDTGLAEGTFSVLGMREETVLPPSPGEDTGPNWIPNRSWTPAHPAGDIEIVHTLCDAFHATGDVSYLDDAIRLVGEMIAGEPPAHPILFLQSILSNILVLKSRSTGLETSGKSTHPTRETHPTTPAAVDGISVVTPVTGTGEVSIAANPMDSLKRLTNEFLRTGEMAFLDNAIKLTEEMMAENPPADITAHLQSILSGLSEFRFSVSWEDLKLVETLEKQFEATGDIIHLDNAIGIIRGIVGANPSAKLMKTHLSQLLEQRFQKTGDLDALDQAINDTTELVAATPPGETKTKRLHHLSGYLFTRFNRLGAMDDLEKTIQACREAVAATRPDDPKKADRLNNLSCCLSSRYEALGVLGDLEKAIQAGEEALEATPSDDPGRARTLDNLNCYLSDRFDRLGDPKDHERVTQVREEVLAAIPPGHPDRVEVLNNLTKGLFNRFDRLGELDGLEEAIQVCEEAVESAPRNHPRRLVALANLSSHHRVRFDRLGARDDLTKAIQIGEQVLAETPLDDPERALRLSNLGGLLCHRFERFGVLSDLEKALQMGEEALAVTPPDHLARNRCLHNLSAYYSLRFRQSGVIGDLEQGIKHGEEALGGTHPDHPRRSRRLNNLSVQIFKRYCILRSPADLDKAIRTSEEAVAATPPNHGTRSLTLLQLATVLQVRFLVTTCSSDFHRSLQVSLDAWDSQMCSPGERIRAARFAVDILVSAEMWVPAGSLLEDAVKLLPEVSPRLLGRGDQEHMLSEFNQLAADAISVALQAGRTPSHCLGLLELGRGIIMGFTIDCRSDLSELRLRSLDSFNTLIRLRTEIDSPSADAYQDPVSQYADENQRNRRVQAINEMGETLRYIRRLPGFDGFQLPPSADELTAIGAEGPIVIFNTTEVRSDAIIVTGSDIKSLALPGLVFSEAENRMKELTLLVRGKRSTYPARNKEMRKILLWLWEVAVGPVFETLGFVAINDPAPVSDSVPTSDCKLPRVWWIGVGPLAMAPFHAAGDHSIGSTRNTLSHAISSYIPTIKALSYTREKRLELLSNQDSRLLLVTMPTTPDTPAVPTVPASPGTPAVPGTPSIPATPTSPAMPRTHGTPAIYSTSAIPGIDAKKWKPLKHAIKEVEDIVGIVHKEACTVNRLDSPTTAQVLEELPTYHAIHFACHGVSDSKNPSNSHLLLRGNTPTEPGMLTVGAISNMNIKNAQIAFLSACSTADNPSSALADESIHIASGFQLAGFSHVLATQWESDDAACRRVAGEFYSALFKGSEKEHRAVSTAFHYAVKNLRKDILGQPIKWAPFIHTGA